MTHTTVTAAEMKALEKAANDNGLLYIQMMENAGRAAFAQLRRRLPGPARLLVAAGRGNNGGDGFVMARVAAKQGWQVQVLLAEGEPKTPDAITNFGSLRDLPVEILHDAASAAPADTGAVAEGAVRADLTVTFHRAKPLHYMPGSAPYCGEVVVADIGIGAYADGQKEE